jgi:hypothetical protein
MPPSALIYETIVTTIASSGAAHIAPMGVRYRDENGESSVLLMPFKPSRTLDNVLATGYAVINFATDVRVFAGCVTGRHDWPTVAVEHIPCVRLADSLGHAELRLVDVRDDATRPVLRMQRVHEAHHQNFAGFNRAQAAVIEGAVLVSRLRMLPADKIDTESAYLQIAIDKTGGLIEREAWSWLKATIADYRAAAAGSTPQHAQGAIS